MDASVDAVPTVPTVPGVRGPRAYESLSYGALWYKAWRESRSRFVLIACALSALCVGGVLFQSAVQAQLPAWRAPGGEYTAYVYNLFYGGTAKGLFATMMLFLGMGGWARERAQGTTSFTLALPVSRARLLWTQFATGALEVALLALIPAALIPALSALTRHTYPLTQALHFSALWFVVGLLLYALTFLLSAVLRGEFTAPAAAYVLVFGHALVASRPALAPYRLNVLWTMGEFNAMRWNADHTLLQSGPLPGARLSVLLLLAVASAGLAVRVVERRDF